MELMTRRKMLGLSLGTVLYSYCSAFASIANNIEKPTTFWAIQEQASSVDYRIEDIYYLNKQGFPKSILIASIHNSDNLNKVLVLLKGLLKPQDSLTIEGLDDNFAEHLHEAQKKYQLDDSYIQKVAEEYKDPIRRQHPYFLTLEEIASENNARLVGADNSVLAIMQTQIKRIAQFTSDPSQQAELYKTYIDMSKQRTHTMADMLVLLSKEKRNKQIYLVAGGIHMGLYPREEPIITPKLKAEGISYALIRPIE